MFTGNKKWQIFLKCSLILISLLCIGASGVKKKEGGGGSNSGNKMTKEQKKYSDMKNHENRVKKYKAEMKFLSYLKTQTTQKEEKDKLSKRLVELIQALRKEETAYRQLRNELRYQFPENKKKEFGLFSELGDETEEEIIFDSSKEEHYDLIREEKTKEEEERENLKQLFQKLADQIAVTYALKKERKRLLSSHQSSFIKGGVHKDKSLRDMASSLPENAEGKKAGSFQLISRQDAIQKSDSEKKNNFQSKSYLPPRLRAEEFQGFAKIVVEE